MFVDGLCMSLMDDVYRTYADHRIEGISPAVHDYLVREV